MGADRGLLSRRSPGVPAGTQSGPASWASTCASRGPLPAPQVACIPLFPAQAREGQYPLTHPHRQQFLGHHRPEAERSASGLQKEKSNHLFVQTKLNRSLSCPPCPKLLISLLAASPRSPLTWFLGSDQLPPSSTPPATLGISVSRPMLLLPPPHPQEAWLENEIRRRRDRTSCLSSVPGSSPVRTPSVSLIGFSFYFLLLSLCPSLSLSLFFLFLFLFTSLKHNNMLNSFSTINTFGSRKV